MPGQTAAKPTACRRLSGFGVQLAYLQTLWLVLTVQSLFLPYFVIILVMWTSLKKPAVGSSS